MHFLDATPNRYAEAHRRVMRTQDEASVGNQFRIGVRRWLRPQHMRGPKSPGRESQRGSKARRADRALGRNRNAAYPQPAQTRRVRVVGDSRENGFEDSPSPVLRDRRAVPHITLAQTRADVELQLADPLRLGGEPPVAGDGSVVQHGGETPDAARQSRSHERGVSSHGGFDQHRAVAMNFFDWEKMFKPLSPALPPMGGGGAVRQVRRPESASDLCFRSGSEAAGCS